MLHDEASPFRGARGAVVDRAELLGVEVARFGGLDELLAPILRAASERRPLGALPVGARDLLAVAEAPALRGLLSRVDLVIAGTRPLARLAAGDDDGAPSGSSFSPRTLFEGAIRAAEASRLPVYLYGGAPSLLRAIARWLRARWPHLPVAGAWPVAPPDDSWVHAAVDRAVADRVRASGARLCLVGLPSLRGARFCAAQRERLGVPALCLGAPLEGAAAIAPPPPAAVMARGLKNLAESIACARLRLRLFEARHVAAATAPRLLAGA